MTASRANIRFTTVPNARVSCTYLKDGSPFFVETQRVPTDASGNGGCGLGTSTGPAISAGVYVIIVFQPDGSELGRATFVYPLP